MIAIRINNEIEYINLFSREKIEKEIIPNKYGLSQPVKFVKSVKGIRLYEGVSVLGTHIYYACKED